MPRVALTGGAYTATSLIAAIQKCVNLYPEMNPQSAETPAQFTYYPRPGKKFLGSPPVAGTPRCTYVSSIGDLYEVVGGNVYYVNSLWQYTLLGTIPNRSTPVSMADNGISVVIVDGSGVGYSVGINSHTMATITDPAFLGADRADYIDTFLIFNNPGTNQFYASDSNAITFNALDIAGKVGAPDLLASVIVMHKEIWLVGTKTAEVWYDAGNPTFSFAQLPGAFIEHGTIAKYSLAKQDLAVYWLSQDMQGSTMCMRGASYAVDRISTHAIEQEWQTYSVVNDAIGFTLQFSGHTFYALTFPTADRTWLYDEATKLWHQWSFIDSNGAEHRDLMNCYANAYNTPIVADYRNGNLYKLDVTSFTDGDGGEVKYTRTFPHMVEDFNRIFYKHFQADMEVGTDSGAIDGSTVAAPPKVTLRISDDRGKTYWTAPNQSIGAQGQYLTAISWWRLGMARDRIFELSWSCPTKTALNGAFIDTDPASS